MHVVHEDRENSPVTRSRRSEHTFEPRVVRRRADLLAGAQLVGRERFVSEPQLLSHRRAGDLENGDKLDRIRVEPPREKVRERPGLTGGQALELSRHDICIQAEVEDREALRRIPAASGYTGTRTGQGISRQLDMAIRRALKRNAVKTIDPRNEGLGDHALDEDAFGQRVDCTEDAPELTSPEKVHRLVVVQERVRRKEPIVGTVAR